MPTSVEFTYVTIISPLSIWSWVDNDTFIVSHKALNQKILLVCRCHLSLSLSLTLSPHKHPQHQSQLNPFDSLSSSLFRRSLSFNHFKHTQLTHFSSLIVPPLCTARTQNSQPPLLPLQFFIKIIFLAFCFFSVAPLFPIFSSIKDSNTNSPIHRYTCIFFALENYPNYWVCHLSNILI